MWLNGVKFYGLSIIANLLKIVPGLLGFLINLFNVNLLDIDTARYITDFVGTSYGIGTNSIGDCLINVGFFPTIIIFVLIGYFFTKCDLKIYSQKTLNIKWFIIWISIISHILFVPRSSLFDLIGVLGFNLIFISFYSKMKMSSCKL